MKYLLIITIIVFVCFIACNVTEDIPSASVMKKIILENQRIAENEHQQALKEAEERSHYLKKVEEQKAAERATARAAKLSKLHQLMLHQCIDQEAPIKDVIVRVIDEFKDSMDEELGNIWVSPDIALCVMDVLMQKSYFVEYSFQSSKMLIGLNKPVDQSRFLLLKYNGVDRDELYQIRCGFNLDACMLFQLEFNECMQQDEEDNNYWYDCKCPLRYADVEFVQFTDEKRMAYA